MGNGINLYPKENNEKENESLFSEDEIKAFLNNDLDLQSIDNESFSPEIKTNSWGILIVDDEEDVHKITKLSLDNFSLNNKGIHFYHAYSAKEAEVLLAEKKDIALIFLDVVMETNSAGLDLVKYIRKKQKNKLIQIILNTGQPGLAPEKEIITKYDINFYQTKAEFTENKLFVLTASSLRAYESLKKIQAHSEELELKVYERTKELELALNTKDKLFSIIAHDLRNPFNTILGFSNLLQQHIKTFNEEQIVKFATTIENSANKIYNLLSNLLDWSRTQNKSIEVNLEKLCINELINENIDLFQEDMKIKLNKLLFSSKKEIYVSADVDLVNTIIRNFLSNAQKYTENGTISISIEEKNNYCKLSIKDTGIGIDAKKLQNILSIAQNMSTKGTQKEKGTGLGLIICKEFIALNKGELVIESEINNGSTFSFTLPLYSSK